jgi:hypothetical protein
MKVRISTRSAHSCLLLPSPINCQQQPSTSSRFERLVPLPLQHRTVRRQHFQRRRFRMKVMMIQRPIISDETTTEDDVGLLMTGKQRATKNNVTGAAASASAADMPTTTDPRHWELAPESSTEDKDDDDSDNQQPPAVDVERQVKGSLGDNSNSSKKKRPLSSDDNNNETKDKRTAKGLQGGDETMLSLVSEIKKKRNHRDVTSLVSPITCRGSKRQRFSF